MTDEQQVFASGFLAGVGALVMLALPGFFWFVHGSFGRYLWIINGPEPFSRFGGGPFQLAVGSLIMVVSGVCFITAFLLYYTSD